MIFDNEFFYKFWSFLFLIIVPVYSYWHSIQIKFKQKQFCTENFFPKIKFFFLNLFLCNTHWYDL